MSKLIDLTNKKFGNLTVLNRAENRKDDTYWVCICNCKKIVTVRADHLRGNKIRSCGCKKGRLITEKKIKHGMTKTRLYNIWNSMIQRCENPKSHKTYLYFDRGTAVCKEWHTFENFMNWALQNGYKNNLTIDRIDNNGNYSPSNCRWANLFTQANNRRTNRRIEYKGENKTLAQRARHFGINYRNLWQRLKRGWNFEQAIMGGVC